MFLNPSARQLITAHVGDSRAVMVTLEESFDLTSDHKPSNASEKERVELLGGRIIQYGVLRVQGVLAVTRALGDFSLRPYVSNVPAVGFVELTGRECFVVLASDGLWDVLDHGDVAALLQAFVRQVREGEGCHVGRGHGGLCADAGRGGSEETVYGQCGSGGVVRGR